MIVLFVHAPILLLIPAIVAVFGCLKGRYALSIVGLFILLGIPSLIAATRLARSDSWWAKRYYDEEKLQRSQERYPGNNRLNNALIL